MPCPEPRGGNTRESIRLLSRKKLCRLVAASGSEEDHDYALVDCAVGRIIDCRVR
jgi:hypothetical protein